MDSVYASRYRELYQRHWWWRAREAYILAAIERHLRRQGGNILDVGCGDGLFFHQLSRYGAVEGLESDATIVTDEGRRWGKIHVGPFDEEFRPAKRYSLILMLDVLEHLLDPRSALRHALELLEPEGILLITVPAFQALWTAHDELNHHLVRYTRSTFRSLAVSVAMRIDEMCYFNHWLFPAKLAVRVKERIWLGAPRPPQIPSTLVNGICYTLARSEAALCSRWPLPFGGSLLVVGGPLLESPLASTP